MKSILRASMILLAVVLAGAAWAAAPTLSSVDSLDAPLPEATLTPDAVLFPELGKENRSAQQCNQYCYEQALACRWLCGSPGSPGYDQCINQCSLEEYQCNCDCGAIPSCNRF